MRNHISAVRRYILGLLIDPATLRFDRQNQQIVWRSALYIGIPICLFFIGYNVYVGNAVAGAFLVFLFAVMATAIAVRFAARRPLAQYLSRKILGFAFSTIYASYMLYFSLIEYDVAKIQWSYLLPVLAYGLNGTRLASFILWPFHLLLGFGSVQSYLHHSGDSDLGRVILRFGVVLPLVTVVTFLTVRLLRMNQKAQGEQLTRLRVKDAELQHLNARLTEEIAERKRYAEELKKANEVKSTLLKEVHHRVKNNLQTLTSLFNLEINGSDDPRFQELLRKNQNRLYSMQVVHEMFYTSKGFGKVDLQDFARTLADSIASSYDQGAKRIRTSIEIPHLEIDLDTAIPCGLLLNEILTNSYKHAFEGRAEGCIEVLLSSDASGPYIRISDDGPGFDASEARRKKNSLGLTLIEALAQQLGGKALREEALRGTVYRIALEWGSLLAIMPENQVLDSDSALVG